MQTRTLQRMQGVLLIIILIGNYALSRTVSGQLMHIFTYPLEAHTDDGELPTPFKTLSSLGFLNSLPRVLSLLSWLQAPECNTVSVFLHVFGSPLLYFIQWQLKPSNVLQLGFHVIVFLYHIPRQSVNKFHCATFKPYLHLTFFGLVLCFILIQANTISHPN